MTEPKITPEMQAIVSVEQKRGNIEHVIDAQKDKLLRNACAYVRAMTPDNQEAFLHRTVTALLDDKLADCFTSTQGKLSIFRIIEESLSTGLELGKHSYAVPQAKKVGNAWIKTARYDVKRQGFHALLCGGDKPLFKDLQWGTVYARDKCSIDGQTGIVKHDIAILKDRGEIIGVWVQADIIMPGDKSRMEAEFYPIDRILEIRNKHSDSWKGHVKDSGKKTPWDTDLIPMCEKTAIKAFCRPWADVKDALAHAIYEESGDSFPTAADERPREEVAELILDATLATPEPVAEPEKEVEPDVTEEVAELANDSKDSKELF